MVAAALCHLPVIEHDLNALVDVIVLRKQPLKCPLGGAGA
jgi:hypothetical protein